MRAGQQGVSPMNLSLTWIRKPSATPSPQAAARPRHRPAGSAPAQAATAWWLAWLPRSTAAGAAAPTAWFQQ
jgi:hypothetical protein